MPLFSLYLHIPYCQSKCPYCDFNSHAVECRPERRYVDALCAELRHYATQAPWQGRQVATIFFGGGTPSLFSPDSIGTVLRRVADLWELADDVETTLEANPGTVSRATLAGYRWHGVNRISFGIQSFVARHLRRLGRIHGPDEALNAVPLARAAGFDNVNLDLIFALPGQTISEWSADLAQACALQPEHISAYNLTYENGTAFHRLRAQGALRELSAEVEADLFEHAQATLVGAGYEHYEVSNYARPGRACRHNLTYWRHEPYLGVGAGAHSFSGCVGDAHAPGDRWGTRWRNASSPEVYMRAVETAGKARAGEETLSAAQARGEFVFLGLRCREGLQSETFRTRFGVEIEDAFPVLAEHARDGLLELHADAWRLTARGLMVADAVFASLV